MIQLFGQEKKRKYLLLNNKMKKIIFIIFILSWMPLIVRASGCADPACSGAVFCSGFEEGNKNIWDDYDGNPDSTNLLMSDLGPCNSIDNTIMRLRVPVGQGGSDLVKVLPSTYDQLYMRWYEKWESGYDFSAPNHGGGLHAGDRGFLGASDYQPDGDDYAGTWLEPNPDLGGRLNLYSYYKGMYQNCVDPDGQCWGDNFPCMTDEGYFCEKPEHRETILTPNTISDKWYCLEIMMDMGTPVQNDLLADGVQNLWVDGVEYGPFQHLWHRTNSSLKLSTLWLNLFHHGAHSLEGVMLDNVVASTQRIGCLSVDSDPPLGPTGLNIL
jgi:hypothetical protein